jgi:NifU-like protein
VKNHPFYTPYPWALYSKKLASKIENPKFSGSFTTDKAWERGMRLVIGREGTAAQGNAVTFYWLVDETDGVIADVKFQVFGASALIGAAEAASELIIRKNYDQAKRISAELIDRQVRDKPEAEAFPSEVGGYLNLVLAAIENAADQCTDIPFADTYTTPSMMLDVSGTGEYPGWKELSIQHKIAVIEEIINKEIRPYIELDAGGVQIVDFVEDRKLIIAYQGSCTSCHSATGSTLSAIEQILRAKVSPDILVEPDLSNLSFAPQTSLHPQ